MTANKAFNVDNTMTLTPSPKELDDALAFIKSTVGGCTNVKITVEYSLHKQPTANTQLNG